MNSEDSKALALNSDLGPLPPADGTAKVNVRWTTTDDGIPCREYEEADAWSERLVREYASEEVARALTAERERRSRMPLTRDQIDAVMTEHYPLDSLPRENVDAFEACVRDIERLLGIGPNPELSGPKGRA